MKAIARLLFLLAVLLFAAPSLASTGSQITIEGTSVADEAYRSRTDLDIVILSDGMKSVGSRAFADSSLNIIRVPDSTTSFGTDWVADAGDAVLVNCSKESAAYRMARSQNLDFDCGGKRLALVIAESYADNALVSTLKGPPTDLATMKNALGLWGYSVNTLLDPTKEQILNAIESTFGQADEYDTCILYYSGHGYSGGNLPCNDYDGKNGLLTADELGEAMRAIDGRKVVIADCCCSGALTETSSSQAKGLQARSLSSDDEEQAFLDDFLSAFETRNAHFGLQSRSVLTDTSDTYVIASCQSDQRAFEVKFSVSYQDKVYTKNSGIFTYYFGNGIGWNGVADVKMTAGADGCLTGNTDNAVSIEEIYTWSKERTETKVEDYGRVQVAAVYPEGADYFAPFRRRINMVSVKALSTEVTAAIGETATLNVTASGTAPFHYQWEINRNDGNGWVKVGDDSASYTTSPVTKENSGYLYRCWVKDATGLSAVSEVITLRIVSPSGNGMPMTGDDTPLQLWLFLLAASAALLLTAARKRKAA